MLRARSRTTVAVEELFSPLARPISTPVLVPDRGVVLGRQGHERMQTDRAPHGSEKARPMKAASKVATVRLWVVVAPLILALFLTADHVLQT